MADSFPILDLTTPLMHGDNVREAQYLLHHNRHGVNFHPGNPDGVYGPDTAAATHRAKYWLGYPHRKPTSGRAKIDHAFGPRLYSYLLPEGHAPAHKPPIAYRLRSRRRRSAPPAPTGGTTTADVWRGKVHEWAMGQVGYKETPVNYTKYNDWYYGSHTAAPWCAIFISYGLNVIGGFKWYKQAYVPAVEQMAGTGFHGMHFVSYADAKRCDIVTFDWDGDGIADHAEFFGKPINSGAFYDVGGNTGGSGGSVAHEERYLSNVRRIIRIPT